MGDSRAAIAASLEESNSAGLSAEMVQAQMQTCKASIPDTYTNLLHQVQNFYALFDDLLQFRTEVRDHRGLDLTEIQMERLAWKLANLSPGLAQSATNTPVPFSGGTPSKKHSNPPTPHCAQQSRLQDCPEGRGDVS